MAESIEPARDLDAAWDLVQVGELEERWSPLYVDLSGGRTDDALRNLRFSLRNAARGEDHFAAEAFTGHRGSGKSSELLRVARELSGSLETVRLDLAATDTIADIDYPDIFLLVARAVEAHFREGLGAPLDRKLLDDVAGWFDQVTETKTRTLQKEGIVEARAKAGWSGLWIGLFGVLTAQVRTADVRQREIRTALRRFPDQLVRQVNRILDAANEKLRAMGGKKLLVLVDGGDRIQGPSAEDIFIGHGDLLQKLRAHVVYVFPIQLKYGLSSIDRTFGNAHVLPMVRVHGRDNVPDPGGLEALRAVVARRLHIPSLFADGGQDGSSACLGRLVALSGGCIRHLMTLLRFAIPAADRDRIDARAVERAATQFKNDLARMMDGKHWPILAQCHLRKEVASMDFQECRDLLFARLILEYNGEGKWLDAHPAVREMPAFQEELARWKAKSSS